MLSFDPSQRLSADSSLVHPFIIGMTHLISPNSTTPLDFSPDEFAFENRKLTIEDLREEITNESEPHVIDIIIAIMLSCIFYKSINYGELVLQHVYHILMLT